MVRFERLGDIADLDEAITAQRQAVCLTPDGHPDKSLFLQNLGNCCLCRFQRLDDLSDLGEAMTAQQQALRLTPDGHPDKRARFHNRGLCFLRRFQRLGDIADLDEAIMVEQHAIRLIPGGHSGKPLHLNSLGISFQSRYERLGDIADIDKAITAQQQAVYLTPDGHPEKPGYLNDLGNSFFCRFRGLHNIADLNEAITAQQQAVRLTPDRHPQMPARLSNLGNSFLRRFGRLDDITDLDEAMTTHQQAVRLIPDDHPRKPVCLSNLGISFQRRFTYLGDIADLDKAITAQKQAVRLTPDGHPDKPGRLNNLGDSFRAQLHHYPDDATLAQAIDAYSQSARASSGPPADRFAAARTWATLCFLVHSNETIDAYSALIDLLPRVVWLGRTVEQRYNDISSIGDAVADAAAAAIHFGEFDLALEWLEQGRSIVWGQMLKLRSPLDELRKHHPDETNELEISRALDSAGVTYPDHLHVSTDGAGQSLEEVAQAHRRLAEKYDHVLARIRELPGFNEFLQPKKTALLCHAAMSGPVVVVNAQKTRGDALILCPRSSQISHVPLPRLQISEVREMQLQLAELTREANPFHRPCGPYSEVGTPLSYILGYLWSYIVEPVLSYLKVRCFNLCPCL